MVEDRFGRPFAGVPVVSSDRSRVVEWTQTDADGFALVRAVEGGTVAAYADSLGVAIAGVSVTDLVRIPLFEVTAPLYSGSVPDGTQSVRFPAGLLPANAELDVYVGGCHVGNVNAGTGSSQSVSLILDDACLQADGSTFTAWATATTGGSAVLAYGAAGQGEIEYASDGEFGAWLVFVPYVNIDAPPSEGIALLVDEIPSGVVAESSSLSVTAVRKGQPIGPPAIAPPPTPAGYNIGLQVLGKSDADALRITAIAGGPAGSWRLSRSEVTTHSAMIVGGFGWPALPGNVARGEEDGRPGATFSVDPEVDATSIRVGNFGIGGTRVAVFGPPGATSLFAPPLPDELASHRVTAFDPVEVSAWTDDDVSVDLDAAALFRAQLDDVHYVLEVSAPAQ